MPPSAAGPSLDGPDWMTAQAEHAQREGHERELRDRARELDGVRAATGWVIGARRTRAGFGTPSPALRPEDADDEFLLDEGAAATGDSLLGKRGRPQTPAHLACDSDDERGPAGVGTDVRNPPPKTQVRAGRGRGRERAKCRACKS